MDKLKRIFVAINLPLSIKQQLQKLQAELAVQFNTLTEYNLNIRWVSSDNIHITLLFLGYLSQQQIQALADITARITANTRPLKIKLTRVLYAPPKDKRPRMIWAEIEKNSALANLANRIKAAVYQDPAFAYIKKEKRPFAAHLTLARFSAWEFTKILEEERPKVERELDIEFEVKSVEVMDSRLKRRGAEYSIIQSYPLLSIEP